MRKTKTRAKTRRTRRTRKKTLKQKGGNIEFIDLCREGKLAEAQEYFRLNPDIDISLNNEAAFRYACGNGHLDVAKWLLQIKPDIDISAYSNFAFVQACTNGYLEVAEWLQTLNPKYYFTTSIKIKYKILTDPEEISQNKKKINWNRKKTSLYASSELANNNILNTLPTDLAKNVNKYL